MSDTPTPGTPGIHHDLTDDAYRAAPGIHVSSAKHALRSAAHYKHALEHPKPPSYDMQLGSLIDAWITDPDNEPPVAVMPADIRNATGKGSRTAQSAWKAEHAGQFVIEQEDLDNCRAAVDAVWSCDAAAELMANSHYQVCAWVIDPDSGLLIAGKADIVSDSPRYIVDLKKCRDASRSAFEKQVSDLNYDMQAAWYLHLWHLLGEDFDGWRWIAVEDKPPNGVQVFEASPMTLQVGHNKMREALTTLKLAVERGEYRGYPSTVVPEIHPKPWDVKRWVPDAPYR